MPLASGAASSDQGDRSSVKTVPSADKSSNSLSHDILLAGEVTGTSKRCLYLWLSEKSWRQLRFYGYRGSVSRTPASAGSEWAAVEMNRGHILSRARNKE